MHVTFIQNGGQHHQYGDAMEMNRNSRDTSEPSAGERKMMMAIEKQIIKRQH